MRRDLRPEMNKKYNTIALYTLVVALIIVSFVMAIVFSTPISVFFGKLFHILSPVLYGFIFAYVLCPACNFFDSYFHKLKGDKKIHKFVNPVADKAGIVITYILFVSALVGIVYIIIPQISDSFDNFYANYQIYIARADRFLTNLVSSTRFIPEETAKTLETALIDFLEKFVESIFAYSPKIINTVSGVAVEIWNIVLGVIISIYMLSERKTFARQGKKLLYGFLSAKNANAVYAGFRKTHEVFGGFVNGKLLDSLIIGIICFIGTSILSIPYAPLVSLIVGITNVIPYFGPFLGAIPSAIIVFLNDPVKSIVFVIFIFLLQQLDGNVIGPKILGQTIGVSSFWIITSLLVMGGLYGVTGMVLAVPLFALIRLAVSNLCHALLGKKGITVTDKGVDITVPEEMGDYDDDARGDGEYDVQNV